MTNIFFESWAGIWHVTLLTIISFITLFVFIRISGKRTLAKFNAFDFVVTVTLGSVLAYMMLAQINLAEGVVVLSIIIALQLLFAKLSRTSEFMEKVFNASPTLLFYKGAYLKANMKKELVTKEEILVAIRGQGIGNTAEVLAVVIEANGDMSVVKKSESDSNASSLDNIKIYENQKSQK
ncbi:DUF421 domain-containing protein [Chryseobacterium cheonjiense]|uniref:DUF421 domain-containing protein n=1 Tax=Chryseobacterium cheonjiense TaxID=2728845 RepID=A0A7Y0A417_9FLAO|nr:YetF domain-containing protein [Chryseobacterium cheonjiense]NML56279.1 DUF421 domain-containing protein [Chryseobacterium cheonjiense]